MSGTQGDGQPPRRWKGPKGPATASGRGRPAKVRPIKARTESSRRWLERQLNDPYVLRAKAEGWRSRAAFKLLELDEKFGFLFRGMRVCDLGVAPGGWAQVCVERGAAGVVGIDILPVEPLAGATLLQMDFLDEAAPARLIEALGGAPDLVLSDMAANATGHARTDQIKTGALAEAAVDFAIATLKPGGAFVAKAFQGGLDAAVLDKLKRAFAKVRHAKPPASRAESPEVYVVAQGFKGRETPP